MVANLNSEPIPQGDLFLCGFSDVCGTTLTRGSHFLSFPLFLFPLSFSLSSIYLSFSASLFLSLYLSPPPVTTREVRMISSARCAACAPSVPFLPRLKHGRTTHTHHTHTRAPCRLKNHCTRRTTSAASFRWTPRSSSMCAPFWPAFSTAAGFA